MTPERETLIRTAWDKIRTVSFQQPGQVEVSTPEPVPWKWWEIPEDQLNQPVKILTFKLEQERPRLGGVARTRVVCEGLVVDEWVQ